MNSHGHTLKEKKEKGQRFRLGRGRRGSRGFGCLGFQRTNERIEKEKGLIWGV